MPASMDAPAPTWCSSLVEQQPVKLSAAGSIPAIHFAARNAVNNNGKQTRFHASIVSICTEFGPF
jgi:hypothetical protein